MLPLSPIRPTLPPNTLPHVVTPAKAGGSFHDPNPLVFQHDQTSMIGCRTALVVLSTCQGVVEDVRSLPCCCRKACRGPSVGAAATDHCSHSSRSVRYGAACSKSEAIATFAWLLSLDPGLAVHVRAVRDAIAEEEPGGCPFCSCLRFAIPP